MIRWLFVCVLLSGISTSNATATSLRNGIRERLLDMRHVDGDTDESLTFESTHWRDGVWPGHSGNPGPEGTNCALSFGISSFHLSTDATWKDLVDVLSHLDWKKGALRSRPGVRPGFALKCTSDRDTAVVLVSMGHPRVQARFASGLAACALLSADQVSALARVLATTHGMVALVPRTSDPVQARTAKVRTRWMRDVEDCLLPPESGIVYYDVPVRILTPVELPDSLRGAGEVLAWVSPGGVADHWRFVKGSGRLTSAFQALKTQRMRFLPAQTQEGPIGAWVEVRL